jgi:hypothetical protein
MRTPLFLQADKRETTGTATMVFRGPAFLFVLKDQPLALLLLVGGVWLWTLVHLASLAVAADAAVGTLEREVHALASLHTTKRLRDKLGTTVRLWPVDEET